VGSSILIYDFDGVICESVDIKTEAYRELYADVRPDQMEEIVRYHLANGGVSRFRKIEHIEVNILAAATGPDAWQRRAERFAALVKDRVIRSPYVPGVRAFIERHAMTHQQYICTGTPESEMRDITDARGISRFFTGIYGSPATKVTILTRIIQEASVDASTCVFFGDALTDHEAAVAIGVPFVGVASHHTEFPVETVVIRDFHDPMLAQVLQR
jgi:phosphoglycolate phosphatase-like HAD superfamily hydrolase